MAKVKAAIDLAIAFTQGIIAGWLTLQIMLGSFSLSRNNAQKREEAKEHIGYVIAAGVLATIARPIITYFIAGTF